MADAFLKMNNITKVYGGIRALEDVDLELHKGELLCLLGENGAGKSTLIKILSGVEQPTKGKITFKGEVIQLKNANLAHKAGFSTVYQEMVQLPDMSIAENIFLGRYPRKAGLIDFRELREMTRRLMDRLGIRFDPDSRISRLSIAQRQLVEIMKAVSFDSEVIIFDEPTSSLTSEETEMLFGIIKRLKENGVSIIYISHRLDEVFQIGDRVMVLRDGKNSGGGMVKDLTSDAIISMMVGRTLENRFPKRKVDIGEVVFEAKNIRNSHVKDVSFHLKKGEVLGFGGLVGAGRSELMRAVMGIDKATGSLTLNGRSLNIKKPSDAIASGIVAVPEDRKEEGLVLLLPIMHNMQLSAFQKFLNKLGILHSRKEKMLGSEYMEKLAIKARSYKQPAGDLSGGNQQKVVLARCLIPNPKVLILDEPTRGIDVGAKAEIYEVMNTLAEQGVSIIMISSELPELLNISDRIIVMHEGSVSGELDAAEATEEMIMKLATREVASHE